MYRIPAIEILDQLLDAYRPCRGFAAECRGIAKWDPDQGYVPRGFVGATASIHEVELIILVAEPGDPFPGSSFTPNAQPRSVMAQASRDTYGSYSKETTVFHSNVRRILDLALPEMSFDEQIRKAWITNSYLCSAPSETGYVPAVAEKACAQMYLKTQLDLLGGRPILALGTKAENRIRRLARWIPDLAERLFPARAASPPGCNRKDALSSWQEAAANARELMSQRCRSDGPQQRLRPEIEHTMLKEKCKCSTN